jgi:hypothetical protein
MARLLLAAVAVLLPPAAGSYDYCNALTALCGGAKPNYVAVISHQEGESSAWATRLPIP